MQIYSRNIPAITEKEQELLRKKSVLIVGCGGIGGYISEYLIRAGVGHITVADGDRFEESNINRQLLCDASNLSRYKAESFAEHARLIDPDICFTAVNEYFAKDNAGRLLEEKELVLDGLDSAAARLLLEDECAKRGLAIVHGAVEGWTLQAGVAPAGAGMLHKLYKNEPSQSRAASVLAFTAACCAGFQAAEAVKLLTGRGSDLENKLMLLSIDSLETKIISMI